MGGAEQDWAPWEAGLVATDSDIRAVMSQADSEVKPTNHKMEPFRRGVAFTAVRGNGRALWCGRSWGRVGGGGDGGGVCLVSGFLMFLDLRHLRTLTILLPVCTAVEKPRA